MLAASTARRQPGQRRRSSSIASAISSAAQAPAARVRAPVSALSALREKLPPIGHAGRAGGHQVGCGQAGEFALRIDLFAPAQRQALRRPPGC